MEPIDLNHLHEFTDGDAEEERMLFALFLESADETIQKLESCVTGAPDDWRQAAHLLKGAAGNLGANALFTVCQDAEHHQHEDAVHKRGYLDAIRAELERVREFIGKLDKG